MRRPRLHADLVDGGSRSWIDFACPVSVDNDRVSMYTKEPPAGLLTLHTGPLPWEAVIDFKNATFNDRFIVAVYTNPRDHAWRLSEFHRIQIGRPSPDYPVQLLVNGQSVSPELLLGIRPSISGNWSGKLTICQTAGISSVLSWRLLTP